MGSMFAVLVCYLFVSCVCIDNSETACCIPASINQFYVLKEDFPFIFGLDLRAGLNF